MGVATAGGLHKGDRVRLSGRTAGRYRYAHRPPNRLGTVTHEPAPDNGTVTVLWDGLRTGETLRCEYVGRADGSDRPVLCWDAANDASAVYDSPRQAADRVGRGVDAVLAAIAAGAELAGCFWDWASPAQALGDGEAPKRPASQPCHTPDVVGIDGRPLEFESMSEAARWAGAAPNKILRAVDEGGQTRGLRWRRGLSPRGQLADEFPAGAD